MIRKKLFRVILSANCLALKKSGRAKKKEINNKTDRDFFQLDPSANERIIFIPRSQLHRL